jgi:hypothetical protein
LSYSRVISLLCLEGLYLIFSLIFVDLYKLCMMLSRCCGMPFFISISNSFDLLMLSDAFSKLIKAINVGIVNSFMFFNYLSYQKNAIHTGSTSSEAILFFR